MVELVKNFDDDIVLSLAEIFVGLQEFFEVADSPLIVLFGGEILELEGGHLFAVEYFDLLDFAESLLDVFLETFEQFFFLELGFAV